MCLFRQEKNPLVDTCDWKKNFFRYVRNFTMQIIIKKKQTNYTHCCK